VMIHNFVDYALLKDFPFSEPNRDRKQLKIAIVFC